VRVKPFQQSRLSIIFQHAWIFIWGNSHIYGRRINCLIIRKSKQFGPQDTFTVNTVHVILNKIASSAHVFILSRNCNTFRILCHLPTALVRQVMCTCDPIRGDSERSPRRTRWDHLQLLEQRDGAVAPGQHARGVPRVPCRWAQKIGLCACGPKCIDLFIRYCVQSFCAQPTQITEQWRNEDTFSCLMVLLLRFHKVGLLVY